MKIRRRSSEPFVVALGVAAITLAACVADTSGISTTQASTSTLGPSTTGLPASSTTSPGTTTTTGAIAVDLPTDGPCSIDGVPETGEATVLVDGRLYGLGADGANPRCLLGDVTSADIEWGPLGDRVRIGPEIHSAGPTFTVDEMVSLEWTAPSGSRIVAVAPDWVRKIDVDGRAESDITFLDDTVEIAYHPAGTHLLAIGTDVSGQYGLWLATNEGADPLLMAFDEGAVLRDAAWTGLGEPLFVAAHQDGAWHIHRVDLTADGALEGPAIVEADVAIDTLAPSQFDPIMLAYRLGGERGARCVEGARATVSGVDLPEPLVTWTSSPVGWLSMDRLLVMAYPNGCDAPGELWSFSAGFCPGSVYGASLLISGVDEAAARQAAPSPPPPPDFTGIIDPAPA